MISTTDPTRALRQSMYLVLGAMALAIATAKIVGAENVYEPSRYKPLATQYDAARADTPVRVWPEKRPEPTLMFGSNDRSRWATVRAIVENGTYVIGKRANFTATSPPYADSGIIFEESYHSIDKVMDPATGEFYSSKPPLFATLLAGEYWLLHKLCGLSIDRDRWLVVGIILIAINVLPFALYLFLLAKLIEQYGRSDFGKLITFAVAAFGTFAITFSATLNNHTPAIFCTLFAIYPLLRSESPTKRDLFLSGLFAGLNATFELPAAAFAGGLGLLLLLTRFRQTLTYFLPGLAIPIIALLACNVISMGKITPAYGEFGGPWYNYGGSHWLKLKEPVRPRGIDFNSESTPIYAMHLLVGHHGWFSLTPIWIIAAYGLIGQARRLRELTLGKLAAVTITVSVVVFAFYLTRFQSYNYGGNTSVARWLIWLSPLWLMGLLHGVDRIADSKRWRFAIVVLLAFSLLSVFYPAWNPWRNPWILQLYEQLGWVRY